MIVSAEIYSEEYTVEESSNTIEVVSISDEATSITVETSAEVIYSDESSIAESTSVVESTEVGTVSEEIEEDST